ncbi:MAG TPA: M36 family metallopeptidase [Methylomirabilota bacterium]|nr:M36 family metallopeptidase [Methylomirabilota bacterium]
MPRPAGSPFRVFDFPMDPATDDPVAYRNAAAVQLFYVCNWMHDKLYELGFTEAAGNFQNNNFGRGGLGNDALHADAQDGGGTDNANMSTPPDGSPPRMQMYIFSGPTPRRDGDFDVEIVLHEYTHGLSNRRVGGGVGISALQSAGMGEGWSDWYGLALLSESGDNVNGNYAAGGYATYQFGSPTYRQNYYFGIRRYPYSTDMTKNPLTFKDIDPGQASSHPGVPINPIFGGGNAAEVHNQGEVWCVALWEARANLINKHGFTIGSQLILQLVTDGMNLSPADPNFLQARDAIILADLVNNGGANRNELWAAFAKRGMGANATSPSSSTTSGVHESYDLPDDLSIVPGSGFIANGPVGGPFSPNSTAFVLTNTGAAALSWTMANTSAWLNVSPAGGVLTPGGPVAIVTATLDAPTAASLPMGIYSATVRFTNLTSGVGAGRPFILRIGQPDYFTEIFEAGDNDLSFSTFTFTPNGSASFYSACRESATNFPTDPAGGNFLSLDDDDFEQIILAGTNTVGIYNQRRNVLFVGSNGYLTMDSGDTDYVESAAEHLNLSRISALYDDLDPSDGGTISWQQLSNRVAVTFQGVPQYGGGGLSSFQFECFFDGRIRLTYLDVGARDGLAGLSEGLGAPFGFQEADLSALNPCTSPLLVTLPTNAIENADVLVGHVNLPMAFATNFTVNLVSSDATEVTVPPSVTIAAGQTNGTFDVTIVNDAELDGTQIAVITASATGLVNGVANIAVHDDESTALQVLVLGNPVEGGGSRPGLVRASNVVEANVSVTLTSSDVTEIQIPPSVTILAGSTFASFPVTAVDDARIDGPQTVTVTAHVENWTNGSRLITVLDNETLNLTVTLPSSAIEFLGILTNAGAVQLTGTLPTNLTVSLLSSDLSEANVPPTATILAGQISGAFNITLVDDLLVDGGQPATVTASAAGWVSGFGTMTVLDDESPPVPFNPAPSHLASNVPANVNLSWDNGGVGITNEIYFDTVPLPGVLLATTTHDTWDLPLLAPNTTYYWQIVANKIGSTPGPIWQFTTRGVDRLEFTAVPSPQSPDQPFSVTVTARDELDRAVSNYLGPVTLSGFVGSGVISNSILPSPFHTISSSGNWTLGYSFTPNTNITITAVRHYFGTKVSIWTDGGVLVAAQPVSSTPGAWLETALPTPIQLTGGTRYRVGAFTDGGSYYWGTNLQPAFPHGTIDQGYEIPGDAFPTSNDGERWFVDLRYTVGTLALVSITPTNSGFFTNGVWAGNVTVSSLATNMILSAKDAANRSGQSNPFHVVPSNQPPLVVTQPLSRQVITGATVNLSVSVFGAGPLNYQWRYEGIPLPHKTNANLVLSDVITNQSGHYYVVAMNPFGTVTSAVAVVTIMALTPFFDDFEPGIDPLQWSGFSSTVRAENFGGSISGVNSLWFGGNDVSRYAISRPIDTTPGGVLDFHLHIASGDDESWEDVDLPEEGIVLEYSTTGGGIWTELGRYDTPAYFSWTHVEVEIPPPAQAVQTQFRWRQLSHSGSCCDHWALDDVGVITGSRPPSIMAQPINRVAVIGGAATFNVTASGSAPLSFQWSRGGTSIPNATNANCTIAGAQPSDAGDYWVAIANPYGSITSAVAALTLVDGGGVVAYFTDGSPTQTGPEAPITLAGFVPLRVADISTYNLDEAGILFLNEVNNGPLTPALQARLPQIQTWVNNGGKLIVHDRATGHLTPNPFLLGFPGIVSTRFETADIDVIPPGDTLVTDGPFGIINNLNLDGGSSSAHGYITHSQLPAGTVPILNTAGSTNNVVSFSYPLGQGFIYYSSIPLDCYLVGGGCGDGSITTPLRTIYTPNVLIYVAGLNNCSNCPPSITLQPVSLTVRTGTNVSFVADASGTEALAYRWRLNGTNLVDGGRISGSASSALTIAGCLESDSGLYSLFVSNAFGTATSSNAVLLVSALDHFTWSAIPSPQFTEAPFAVSIQARDVTNGLVTNYSGSVALSGRASATTTNAIANPSFESGLSGWLRSQAGFYSNSLSGTVSGGMPTHGVNYWRFYTPDFAPMQVTNFARISQVVNMTGMGTLVFDASLFAPGGWSSRINGEVRIDGVIRWTQTAAGIYTNQFIDVSALTGPHTLELRSQVLVPGAFASHWVMFDNLRSTAGGPITVLPANTGGFSNGVWNGNVTVLQPATNFVLIATDGLGHSGTSTNFNVLLVNDLSVTISDVPDPVAVGALLTNIITVNNAGPGAATGITATNFLPASVSFVSANASQGSCALAGGRVECTLGSLLLGEVATITVVTTPGAAGQITNRVAIGRAEADGFSGNNSAESVTGVLMPSLTISDVSLLEGNSGVSPAVFNVRLSPASPINVSVSFATSNGSALADSDYVSTLGVLAFLPGQTNRTVTVLVNGDTAGEPTETFFLNLSGAVNASLGDSQAIATILNDDAPPDAYLRSTAGIPWGSTANETAMNRAFGSNNWQNLRYETVNPAALFTPATRFIFMEGSEFIANELQAFLAAHRNTVENWVAAGGRLFLNSAPSEGAGMNFGFGVNLVYSDPTSSANASDALHPIFAGPFTPVDLAWTGTSFGHATVSGTNLTALIANSVNGRLVLGEKRHGAGLALFGGMTTDNFHSAQPQAANLRANILAYAANFIFCSNCPPSVISQSAGQTVRPGTNVSFTVIVSGTGPLTYQWRRDGADLANGGRISGATSSVLNIASCLESDSGMYSLLISNAFGTATSSIVTLVVSALDHFTWSVVPSPQVAGQPFAVTIEARDFSNHVVTNFSGPVALSGLANSGASNSILSAPAHDNFASGSFSLGYAFTPNADITVTAVRHYFGTRVSIWTDAGLLVIAQPVSSAAGTWLETPLPSPVQLTAGTRYRVAAFTGGGTYHWRTDGPATFPHGTIDQTFNGSGDVFPISSDAARWWFVDLRYNVGTSTPVPITPATSGSFTAGVWSGDVTVLAQATNMVLQADNGAGATGLSNPFHAVGTNQPPIIVRQPAGSQVLTGATVNLSVSVFATPPVSYQWRFNGGDLLHETNASLVLTGVITNQSGSYSVFVTNLFGSATSVDAVVTVVPGSAAVAVFDDPAYVDTSSGGVGAEADNLRASIQSFGVPTTNVTDLVAAVGLYQRLIIPEQEVRPLAVDLSPLARAALSNYVFNGGKLIVHGNSSGAGATLLNAIFGFAVQEVSSGGLFPTRGPEAGETEFGDDPLTLPDNNSTTVLLRPSLPLNALNLYTNSIGSDVVLLPHGAGTIIFIGWDWYNAAPIGTQNGGWLTVLESALLQGPLVPRPAAITSQPASQAAGIGVTVNFSVGVSGTPPFSYQWRRDGVNLVNGGRISGAAGSALTIANSFESDSGLYSVTVSNAFGGAVSSNAMLTVGLIDHFTWTVFPSTQATLVRIEARDISNRLVGNFQGPVNLSASAGGVVSNTILASPIHAFSAAGNFTLGYSFTPRSNMTVTAVRHYFGTKVSIWTDAGVLLATQNVSSVPGTWVETPLASPVQLVAGLRYRVAAYVPSGNYYYRNDLGTNFPFGTINQSYDLAGDTFPTLTDSVRWWLVDLRYSVVAGTGTPVAVSPATSGPFMAGAWTGMMWASQVISNAVLRATDGLGHSGESAPVTLYTQGPVTFAVQPHSQNVLPGTNVTLTALAIGTAPVRYQWQFEGAPVLHATNASYSFANASVTDIGNYSVIATDGATAATSSNAYIFVIVRPGFVEQPQPQTVLQGQSAAFSVVVTGAPPLYYRWIRGGLPYATSSVPMMVFTNNQISTIIRVSVTNLATGPGGITSAFVPLTVLPDHDADGMADLWEAQHGFNTNNAADALLDFDGDGMINRDEYVANTIPHDPLSLLKLTWTATNAGVLQFVAQANIGYTLQFRTNLNLPSWMTLTAIAAQPSQVRTVLVNAPIPPPESIRFYRIVTPLVP